MDQKVKSGLGITLAILFLVGVFLSNIYMLWKPYSFQVEGDVLIHLVFARNIAEGNIFEYGHDQLSRAGTSMLWESMLGGLGHLAGLADSEEGFLALARCLSALFLVGFGGLCYVALKTLHASHFLKVLIPVASIVHPITFYWCIANPMETSLALVLIMLLVLGVLHADRFRSVLIKGALFALLSLSLFLTRPELILLAAVSVGLLSVRHIRSIDWAFLFSYGTILLFFLIALGAWLHSYDLSIFASAGSARRLSLQNMDTILLPLLNMHFNPDAWIFVALFFPLVWGALKYKDSHSRFTGFLATIWLLLLALFFSFYFCSTWLGRYLLPVLSALAPLGAVGLWSRFQGRGILLKAIIGCWVLAAIFIPLKPLAAKAKAVDARSRSAGSVVSEISPDKPTTFLVQEVQSVYFYPELIIISTDGLIDLQAVEAYRSDMTVYEFIMEHKPDWIGTGRYYLRDPERVQARTYEAAKRKESLRIGDITLEYLGIMKGSGPVFDAIYSN